MKRKLDLSIILLSFLIVATVCFISSTCSTDETSKRAERLEEPDVSTNYIYYEIIGSTANELRTQMDRLGPSDELRVQHDAYTEWYVDWSYPNSTANDRCRTGPVKVTVTITQTFPKWDIPPDASQALVDKWKTYVSALQTHEAGHKRIGVEAGYQILRTLNEIPAYPSCSELEQVADAAGERILDEFRQKEATYDQTTAHGASQGARFP